LQGGVEVVVPKTRMGKLFVQNGNVGGRIIKQDGVQNKRGEGVEKA